MAMRSLAAVSCMLTALALAGCVPNAVRYYRPSVAGGTVIKGYCVPTKSTVEFDLHGNKGSLHIRAWANRDKQINFVDLSFSGKAWEEIHFTSTNFRIRDSGKHLLIGASSVIAYKKDSISKLTTEPYRAPPQRLNLSRFSIQVNFADPLPDKFELLSPSIVIDGKQVDFPIIRFERSTWVGISPFNC